MKELYYYIGRNAPRRSTVCLLVDEWTGAAVARGLAMCSKKDQFVKKTGRFKALSKANQALLNLHDSGEIHGNLKRTLETLGVNNIMWFSSYEPDLTEYEKNIIKFALPKKEAK